MKKLKKTLKAGLAVVLAASMAGSYPNMPAVMTSANATEEIYEEYFAYAEMETSAYPISFYNAETGIVDQVEGNHINWIDRIDLPEKIKKLYEVLEEGADNDGNNDFLIDDKYYSENGDNILKSGTSTYNVITALTETRDQEMSDMERDYILDCITTVMSAFDRDHPEVFWLTGASLATMSGSSNGTTYQYNFYFILKRRGEKEFDIRDSKYQNQNDIKTAIAQRNEDIQKICDEIPKNADAYQKMVSFNSWLTKNNEYNTSDNLNNIDGSCRECISALAGTEGTMGPVCEAYARAFKVLCDKEGIPCVLVDGNAINSSGKPEAHMWNYAQLDEKWYGVDVTWNDPKVAGVSGKLSNYEREDYLLVGSDTVIDKRKFIESHPVSNQVSSNGIAFTNGPKLNTEKYQIGPKVVEKPTLTGVYGTAVEEMKISGGKVKSGDTELKGKWEVTDNAKEEKPSVGTEKSYKLTFTSDDTSLSVDTEVVPEVEAKKLNEGNVVISDSTNSFIYDGTPKTLPLEVKDSEADITEKDYTIEYKDNRNASTDSVKAKAIVTGQNNYKGSVTKEFTIKKAEGEAVTEPKEYFYGTGSDGSVSIALSTLLPEDAGTASYNVSTTDTEGTIIDGTPSIEDGVLSYTIKEGKVGDTAKIVVIATTENYKDITITINISMSDKTEIDLQEGSKVALETDTLVYGESLSKLKFKEAVFVAKETGDVVEGKLSWEDENAVLPAGTHKDVGWVFTPESNRYQSKEGTIEVKVDKAEQTGFSIEPVTEKTYGDAAFTLTTTGGNEDGAVTYQVPENNGVLSINGNNAEILGAGTVKVSAIKAESDNYKEAKAELEITVAPKSLKTGGVKVSEITEEYTYQGRAITPNVTVSDGETELVKEKDYDITYRNNINASTETQKAEVVVTGKGNYKDELTASFTIQKAGSILTIEEENIEKTYSTEPFAIEAKVNSDAEINYTVTSGSSIISVEKGNVTMKKIGIAEITISAPATANFHAAESRIVTITVLQAENVPNMPEDTMEVPYSNEKVKDVVLPEGWGWQEADKEKELIVGTVVTAGAIYINADKDNYKNTSVIVSLKRQEETSGDNPEDPGNTPENPGNTPGNTDNNPGNNNGNTGDNTGNNGGNIGGGSTGGSTGNTGSTITNPGSQTDNKEDSSNQEPSENQNNNTGNNPGNNTEDNKTPTGQPENEKTTETKPDGTVVETVVETKQDGTVVETVTENRTDGLVIETITEEKPDGTKTGNISIEIQQKTIDSAVLEKKNVVISVDVSSKENADIDKIILTKDGIDAAKNAGKGLVIKINAGSGSNSGSYQVTIPAKQLKKLEETCNIAVNIEKASETSDSKIKESITKALAQSNGKEDKVCVVSTKDTAIKAGMKITVPVSEKTNIKGNSTVYVYKYNAKTGKFVEAAYCKQVLSADGNVVISAKAGTSYVLSAKKLKGKQVKTIKSQISVAASKKSVKAGKTAKVTVDLPDTVSTKSKFATEKAVITYRSNHPNVASVSKTGKINAKKQGTVTITTTIALESGQKITKKQKITIK